MYIYIYIYPDTICTTILELDPKRPSLLWFWGPNSIVVVCMGPLGYIEFQSKVQAELKPSTLDPLDPALSLQSLSGTRRCSDFTQKPYYHYGRRAPKP